MHLSVVITRVEDGKWLLAVKELPSLAVVARNFDEIPAVVSSAAARLLDQNPADFTVEVLL